MAEKQRTGQQILSFGGSPFDDDDDDVSGGLVTVLHAPFAEDLPVGEMTIREVRTRYNDHIDLHPDAVAYVNGNEADDDTVLHEGERLMFMRQSGIKGAA